MVSSPCGDRHHVDTRQGHAMFAAKCLRLLNRSLRRNICNLPEDKISALAHDIKDLSTLPEALRYSCLHWASHPADSLTRPIADVVQVPEYLRTFADKHLLHWLERLSAFVELESG